MADFIFALEKTLRWEGGYQDSPADPGNYNSVKDRIGTNLGISAPVLEKHIGRVPSREDMLSLSKDTAAEIYIQYWRAVRAGEIRDNRLAALIFDMAVNHGPASAVRVAQRAVGAKPDGKIGPVTLALLNRKSPEETIKKIVEARLALYAAISRRSPQMRIFLRGWERRAKSFLPDP